MAFTKKIFSKQHIISLQKMGAVRILKTPKQQETSGNSVRRLFKFDDDDWRQAGDWMMHLR